jgi:RHS repeat-associated protein
MAGFMPEIQYQFSDHLGSATLMVDRNAALLSHEEFTSYGETSFGGYERKHYRYLGLERDEETGLAAHGLRYYASWTCRWISCDPIGAKGGMNLYQYSGCDPINFNDRSGLDRQGVSSGGIFSREQCYAPGHEPLSEHFDNLTKLSPEEEERIAQDIQDAYENNQTVQRWDEKGNIYTKKEEHEADERRVNRHRDSNRLVTTVKFSGQVLTPVHAALLSSIIHSGKSIYYRATGQYQAASAEGFKAVGDLVEAGATKLASKATSSIGSSRLGQTQAREEGLARVQEALQTHRDILQSGSHLGPGEKVAALLKVGKHEVYGFNGMWDNPFTGLNAHWGHAELDAMGKMFRRHPIKGLDAEMWVTTEACRGACLGQNLEKGNIMKAAEQMGLGTLTIHSPTETIVIANGKVVSWVSY